MKKERIEELKAIANKLTNDIIKKVDLDRTNTLLEANIRIHDVWQSTIIPCIRKSQEDFIENEITIREEQDFVLLCLDVELTSKIAEIYGNYLISQD